MKTSELMDAKLDLAVSMCEQVEYWHTLPGSFPPVKRAIFKPSSNWSQGGPIIERKKIGLWSEGYDWEAKIQIGSGEWITEWADTPLIAAMRCYVASKLGDEIELPEGLTHD